MPKRKNELEAMIRSEPFAYRAAYDSSNNVQYEGWAVPGSATSAANWVIARHTYDSSNNLTATEWATPSSGPAANFDQIWDNRTSLTYI